jgi:hypothetical protein
VKESYCRLVPGCFAVQNPQFCKYAQLNLGGKCIYLSIDLLICINEEAEKEAITEMKKED